MDKQEEKVQEDPQIATKVGELLNKHESSLTPSDIEFLRARMSYIGRRSRARLAHLLTPSEEVKKEEPKKEDPKKEESKKPEEAPRQEDPAQHPADVKQPNEEDDDVE